MRVLLSPVYVPRISTPRAVRRRRLLLTRPPCQHWPTHVLHSTPRLVLRPPPNMSAHLLGPC